MNKESDSEPWLFKNGRLRSMLEVAGLWIAIIMGSINLGILLWKGGALVSRFEAMEIRVNRIEQIGTPVFQSHKELDDMREMNARERMAKIEGIAQLIPSLDAKLAVIDTKLSAVQVSLEEHKKEMKQ